MANSWDSCAGRGAARAMFVAAAAARLVVAAAELTVKDGIVSHPASGRSASFGGSWPTPRS